jgi:hypothetical protein
VVDLAGGVDPHETRSAAGRLCQRGCRAALVSWRCWCRRGGRGSSRSRSRWCWCWCWCSGSRCRCRRRGSCGGRCRAARAAVPILNTLVTVTCASLRGTRPICTVFTLTRGAGGRAGRRSRLCHHHPCGQ